MYFLIEDDGLLKKYIWDKVSADIKNNLIVKNNLPIIKQFWKPKQCYGDVVTDFYDKEIP